MNKTLPSIFLNLLKTLKIQKVIIIKFRCHHLSIIDFLSPFRNYWIYRHLSNQRFHSVHHTLASRPPLSFCRTLISGRAQLIVRICFLLEKRLGTVTTPRKQGRVGLLINIFSVGSSSTVDIVSRTRGLKAINDKKLLDYWSRDYVIMLWFDLIVFIFVSKNRKVNVT